MPGSGTATYVEPDAYEANLRQLRLNLVVTSQGTFKARLTWATLDHMQLLHCEEDLPRIAYVSLDPALVFVGFATDLGSPVVYDGRALEAGEIIVHSRGEQFHHRTTGRGDWNLVGLVPADLEKYRITLSGQTLGALEAPRILRPAARDAARLRRLHAQACRLAETRSKVLTHPEVARAIEQGLVHALVTCLAAKPRDELAPKRSHASIMVRFEQVLADFLSRPLHMPELCTLIGVSERTLRSCCAAFLGVSPSTYVFLRRLKAARIALRAANPGSATVADIAGSCGFTEPGRFAGAYQAAFGELPSTTLRRSPVTGLIDPKFADSA